MSGIANIGKIPELQRRIIFTILMFLIFRVGCHLPVPGINVLVLTDYMEKQQQGMLGLLNTFTGGAFNQMSIFALGIMPYITASIIFSLLAVVVPYIEQLQKEGELGRRKINQYTRYSTVLLSAIQAVAISVWLESLQLEGNLRVVGSPGITFKLMTVITLTTGTIFLMWMGEQITERGIGNGISLLIFAGIVDRMPGGIADTLRLWTTGQFTIFHLLAILIFIVLVIGGIVYVERAQRRLPVQYPSRTVGRKMYKGVKTHLPLRVNTAGVIPPIFAMAILQFPLTITQFFPNSKSSLLDWFKAALDLGSWQYATIYGILIIFFTFFYTAVQFNPVDVADNLKKHGGYIPGVRPGKNTADHIDRVLTRVTVGGAIYLVVVCVMPSILMNRFGVPFYFGGTSLLIVVGVALDTASQMEAHMLARHYDGFLGAKGGKIKGRRR